MKSSLTRAAEGFDRRAFTAPGVVRMQEAGVISEDENFELIEGEIAPTQAKTHAHELIKSSLGMGLARALKEQLWLNSLSYDRGLKGQIYSHYGVRELWVIDASRRRAYMHSGPRDGVWESVVERGPQDALTCAAIPSFSAKLRQI